MPETDLIAAFLRDRDFICPDCRYNMRGLNTNICPECGLGFRLTLTPIAGTWGDPKHELQRLTDYLKSHDARCPTCRTNLRNHDDLACPRCGMQLSVWLLRPRGIERGDSMSIIFLIVLLLLIPAVISVIIAFL